MPTYRRTLSPDRSRAGRLPEVALRRSLRSVGTIATTRREQPGLEGALDRPRLSASGRVVGADAHLEDVAGVLGRDGRAAPLGDRGQELGDAGAEVPGRAGDVGPLALAAP